MQNIDDEIRSKTEAFVSTLTSLVRQAALQSVSAALGGTPAAVIPAGVVKRGRGRPRKVVPAAPVSRAPARAATPVKAAPAAKPAAARPAVKVAVAKKAAAAKRPFGAKRPPSELAKLTDRLGDYIKSHPGLRIEPIGAALAIPTKDLTLPVKKLLAAKRIRSEGQKRATEYFPI